MDVLHVTSKYLSQDIYGNHCWTWTCARICRSPSDSCPLPNLCPQQFGKIELLSFRCLKDRFERSAIRNKDAVCYRICRYFEEANSEVAFAKAVIQELETRMEIGKWTWS